MAHLCYMNYISIKKEKNQLDPIPSHPTPPHPTPFPFHLAPPLQKKKESLSFTMGK